MILQKCQTGINGVITNNEMIRTNSYGSVITIKANSADGKVFNYDTIETLGSSYSDIDIEAAKKVTNDGLIVTEGRRGNIAITVTGADGTVTNSGTIRAQMYDSRIDIAATGIESAVTNEEGATIETLGNNSPIKITTAGSVTNDSMIRTTGLGGNNHPDIWINFFQLDKSFLPAHLWHIEIENNNVESVFLFVEIDCFLSAIDMRYLISETI